MICQCQQSPTDFANVVVDVYISLDSGLILDLVHRPQTLLRKTVGVQTSKTTDDRRERRLSTVDCRLGIRIVHRTDFKTTRANIQETGGASGFIIICHYPGLFQ